MPIIFEPWIGRLFEDNNHFGIRVLVLGESHYGDGAETRATVTSEVVRSLAQDERHAFFTKVSKVLLGLDGATTIDNETRGEIWEHIAFYNYIQGFVGTDARVRPTAEMWDEAREPFFKVVHDLNPKLILVLGKELGNSLPNIPEGIEVCIIQHPSTGFSYEKWNPLFLQAIQRAKEN
jgi:hypothetical protein